MSPLHTVLAVGLTIVWGINFVAIHYGLDHYPPLFFVVLRFAVAGLPILFLPRPRIPILRLILISMTLFVGQFAFLLPGMKIGFPPGLASLTLQLQAFLTVMIASAVLGERPKARNIAGLGIAFLGLAAIATTVGSDGVTLPGFLMILGSAASWATGNVLLRGAGKVDMLALNSWNALIAVLPLLVLSLWLEGARADWAALITPSLVGLGALFYIAVPTTILGYWLWGELLKRYPAGLVAPFTLLVPITGTLSSYLILGESFGPMRLAGMVLIMIGLAVNTVPLERWLRRA
jgi:O-acetylserine/cysteine efflux transporter